MVIPRLAGSLVGAARRKGIVRLKLRMLPISRIAAVVFWPWITIPVAVVAARNLLAIVVVTVPLVIVGAVLSIRTFTAGVDCIDETVTIRGCLRTRRIPIGDVIGVDESPYHFLRGPRLRWTDRHGRIRSTRISAFGWTLHSHVNAHSEKSLLCLSQWIAQERTQLQPVSTESRSKHRRKRRKKRRRT